MSAAKKGGRKRAREFKLGGQRAQQVHQARANAVAAQFDKLAPDVRASALTALHGRCTGAEQAELARLYYRGRTAAAGARGAEALRTERKMLAMDCIRTLWDGADVGGLAAALSELQSQLATAPPSGSDAQGFLLPAPAGRGASATARSMGSATATADATAAGATAVGTMTAGATVLDSSETVLGVTIETQTPTGLPQLLLAEALSWHGQSPPAAPSPAVNSIGVGTAAQSAATAESHTQTFGHSSAPPPGTTSLASPGSVDAGTSTTAANEPIAGGWSWEGLDATTQTARPAGLPPSIIVGDSAEDLAAPSPQQAPSSAGSSSGGRTTESGTSPLRFPDDAFD